MDTRKVFPVLGSIFEEARGKLERLQDTLSDEVASIDPSSPLVIELQCIDQICQTLGDITRLLERSDIHGDGAADWMAAVQDSVDQESLRLLLSSGQLARKGDGSTEPSMAGSRDPQDVDLF